MAPLKEKQPSSNSSKEMIYSTLKIRDEGKYRVYTFEYSSSNENSETHSRKKCQNKENHAQILPNRLRWGRNRPVIDYYGNKN